MVLRISEVHDLGDVNRFSFYEMTKTIIAAPPDVHRVNEKHRPEYYIPNVNGVIITSNYLSNGIYLPPDDRRHYVAWSDCTLGDFENGYSGWITDRKSRRAIPHRLAQAGYLPVHNPGDKSGLWKIRAASRWPTRRRSCRGTTRSRQSRT